MNSRMWIEQSISVKEAYVLRVGRMCVNVFVRKFEIEPSYVDALSDFGWALSHGSGASIESTVFRAINFGTAPTGAASIVVD